MQIRTQQGSEWRLKFRLDKISPFVYVFKLLLSTGSPEVYREVEVLEMFFLDGEYSDILSRSAAVEGLNSNVLTCAFSYFIRGRRGEPGGAVGIFFLLSAQWKDPDVKLLEIRCQEKAASLHIDMQCVERSRITQLNEALWEIITIPIL